LIKTAFLNLWRKKTRTILSIAMIAVGVAAIIAMTSLADGLFMDIKSAVSQIQGITIYEKSQGILSAKTDEKLVDEIKKIPGVKDAKPLIIATTRSIEGRESNFGLEAASIIRLFGTTYKSNSETVGGVKGEILKGRNLKEGERNKVVIGKEIADRYNKFVGDKIRINNSTYEIVGIYRTGSKFFNLGILMALEDLRELAGFPQGKVSEISVELDDPTETDRMVNMIKFKLGDKYRVISSSQFAESLSNVLDNVKFLVMAVASIAAIVAAVGILNTMLMSVMERYKEIGVLKATGWTNGNIMRMVLYESAILGILGGTAGIILGMALSKFVENYVTMRVYVSQTLLIESFIFAIAVGLFAGLYPAWKASTFNPVDALRAE